MLPTYDNIIVHTQIKTKEQRAAGFMDAMEASPGREYRIIGNGDFKEAALSELQNHNGRTAFFCTGDMFALELMNYLAENHRVAPDDYGIMGFDNIDTLQYISPRLSTTYNAVEEVAVAAVNLLFDLIEGTTSETEKILPFVPVKGDIL